ncbi:hypothetical protein PSCLAVI8L_90129 [Pseudoclavibacter sp. 8L]|nr:hypothetical protein PSCLAVI8L_90129 [Pseudoclavibacter sp. 8L]
MSSNQETGPGNAVADGPTRRAGRGALRFRSHLTTSRRMRFTWNVPNDHPLRASLQGRRASPASPSTSTA